MPSTINQIKERVGKLVCDHNGTVVGIFAGRTYDGTSSSRLNIIRIPLAPFWYFIPIEDACDIEIFKENRFCVNLTYDIRRR